MSPYPPCIRARNTGSRVPRVALNKTHGGEMCRKFKVNVAWTVFKRRRHLACARDHYSETHERALPKIRFIIRNAVVLTTTPTTPNPATSYIRQCVLYMRGRSIYLFRNTYFRIFIEKLFSKYVFSNISRGQMNALTPRLLNDFFLLFHF